MAVTVTTTISCPLFCEGGEGTVKTSFASGTAKVTCCNICNGGSFTVRNSEAAYYMRPVEAVTTYQHRNGLVTLTGRA